MPPVTERAPRLMLLDTPSLYFRAFHGVPSTLTAPDGTPVNAVRGLLDFVARLVTDRSPTALVACFDADWRPAFRVAALAQYKAHRLAADGGELVPAKLVPQVAVIEQVLDAVGIARLGVPGYEADDLLGTLAARADCPVDVVTGDRDLFQLVDDARGVRVLYTATRGVGAHEVVDEAAVTAKYAIPGRRYADFALLRGDPSDGLPGVAGIGEKSAAELVRTFGGLEGILAALRANDPRLSPGLRRKLEAGLGYLLAAVPVVHVSLDAPVPDDLDAALPARPRDPDRVRALTKRWRLGGSMDRLLTALGR